MKRLLFEDLYCWSIFSELRQLDFNGHLWVRPELPCGIHVFLLT